ncbi:hypothetical protein DFQ14_101298 [Halopolyspora algeriensis]|uniref:Uncharacterized protein n=1 Tax=Halopolyspora algeriensis TaxID=1500506 RepID=A0A368VXM6_9ACTN|nr:hypothetical protein DFQ14_101298 [Halopolyspora algeriensis]TQM48049.1 hypothetical protein FHU43_3002 [Halopolyspora algeriensis]
MILSSGFPLMSEESHAMIAHPSIDPARFLHEHLSQASPDLLRRSSRGTVDGYRSSRAAIVRTDSFSSPTQRALLPLSKGRTASR